MLSLFQEVGYGCAHTWVESDAGDGVLLFHCYVCDHAFAKRPEQTGSMCGIIFAAGVPDECTPSLKKPKQSAIMTRGFGRGHSWVRGSTAQVGSWGIKRTYYRCGMCRRKFTHYYDCVPNIHTAMFLEHVPNRCTVTRN